MSAGIHNSTTEIASPFRKAAGESIAADLPVDKPQDAAVTVVQKKSYPRVTLRLSEEENARLRDLAQGMSLSAYIRKSLFGKEVTRRKHRVHSPVQDQQSFARALALLGESRIANNLNQLAYHANTGTLEMDEISAQQINEAYAHIMAMRDQLIKALGLIEDLP